MAPTAKGKMEPPDFPTVAANPMPEMWRREGSSLDRATTAAGKMGPRKQPSNATATVET